MLPELREESFQCFGAVALVPVGGMEHVEESTPAVYTDCADDGGGVGEE